MSISMVVSLLVITAILGALQSLYRPLNIEFYVRVGLQAMTVIGTLCVRIEYPSTEVSLTFNMPAMGFFHVVSLLVYMMAFYGFFTEVETELPAKGAITICLLAFIVHGFWTLGVREHSRYRTGLYGNASRAIVIFFQSIVIAFYDHLLPPIYSFSTNTGYAFTHHVLIGDEANLGRSGRVEEGRAHDEDENQGAGDGN